MILKSTSRDAISQPRLSSLRILSHPPTHKPSHGSLGDPSDEDDHGCEYRMAIQNYCVSGRSAVMGRCTRIYAPRKPKPAAMPPSTFLATHSRSRLSSSRIWRALDMMTLLYNVPFHECGWGRSGVSFGFGRHIDKRKSRKSLVKEE